MVVAVAKGAQARVLLLSTHADLQTDFLMEGESQRSLVLPSGSFRDGRQVLVATALLCVFCTCGPS